MKADHLEYARAAKVSLLGMALQAVLGLILLVYSVLGHDDVAFCASGVVLLGIAVWITIAIVFDQHRRERLEAMEAESLDAASAQQAAVFQSTAAELRVAARRLAWIHTFLVPGVSIALGIALLAWGWWCFRAASSIINNPNVPFAIPSEHGWAIAIGLSIAVIGFIFARFISGMAKQKVWANLRGGAAYAVLAAVLGGVLAIIHFATIAGSLATPRYAMLVVPVFAMLLGLEVFVNFLFNLYRPRRPGEVPRAAFDSPILGFVASPDRLAETIGGAISYQFGVDVTTSWAYRVLSRSVLALTLLGCFVLWLLTAVTIVGPNEGGLRLVNGELRGVVGPGLYFKPPWPFGAIDREQTTLAREIDLATPRPDPSIAKTAILWTNEHGILEKQYYTVVQPHVSPALAGQSGQSSDSVKDLAIFSVEVPLIYAIDDLAKFENLAVPSEREELIKAIAQREVLAYLATLSEDELLGADRAQANSEIQKRITAALAKANEGKGAGVRVLYAGLEGVHPPLATGTDASKTVAKTFEEVVINEHRRDERIEMARTDEVATLSKAAGSKDLAKAILAQLAVLDDLQTRKAPAAEIHTQEQKVEDLMASAGGQAAQELATARADRWERHMAARGSAEAYAGQLDAFHASPAVYKASRYFDTMLALMKNSRVYITNDTMDDFRAVVDLKDLNSTSNVFTAPTTP